MYRIWVPIKHDRYFFFFLLLSDAELLEHPATIAINNVNTKMRLKIS